MPCFLTKGLFTLTAVTERLDCIGPCGLPLPLPQANTSIRSNVIHSSVAVAAVSVNRP